MSKFREGWQSFIDGLDKRHILEYGSAVWGHAWEIFWGAGVIGLICTLLTLYYAPSRWLLGWVFAWVFLVSGYYVWRADHLRLMPKLDLGEPITVFTPTNIPQLERKFVQIPVNCAENVEVGLANCKGQILRVWKWVNDNWEPTQIDETLDLNWPILDEPIAFLEPGVGRRLNICFVHNVNRNINIATNRFPFRMALSSAPSDLFRFDIRVSANGCLAEYKSINIRFGEEWDDLAL